MALKTEKLRLQGFFPAAAAEVAGGRQKTQTSNALKGSSSLSRSASASKTPPLVKQWSRWVTSTRGVEPLPRCVRGSSAGWRSRRWARPNSWRKAATANWPPCTLAWREWRNATKHLGGLSVMNLALPDRPRRPVFCLPFG